MFVSTLKRYLTSVVLAIITVVLVVLAVLSLTVWRPAQQVSASAKPTTPFVVTRAGLLSLYGNTATVTFTAANPTDKIWVAQGQITDINAWLTDRPYEEIGGLETLDSLKITLSPLAEQQLAQSGAPAPTEPDERDEADEQSGAQSGAQSGDETTDSSAGAASSGSPIASDMWYVQREGVGTLSAVYSGDDIQVPLLIAGNGVDPAPEITITWKTPRANTLAWVLCSVMAVFALATVVVWAVTFRRHRRHVRHRSRIDAAAAADNTDTSAIPMPLPSRYRRARGRGAQKDAPLVEDLAAEDELLEDADEPSEPIEGSETIEEASESAPDPAEGGDDGEVEESDSDEPADSIVDQVDEPELADEDEPEPETESDDEETEPELPDTASHPVLREEVISPDSGLINLSALQTGAIFPTRSALRDAQKRGVDRLVVGGKAFDTDTGAIPVAAPPTDDAQKSDSATDKAINVLSRRSMRRRRGNERPGEDR